MNMLMDCREYNIPVLEVPIQTVYLEGNASTHFHPVRDSIRIYAIFGKFLATSLSSSVIDIVLFTVFSGILQWLHLGHVILAATVGARVVSSIYNFLMNKGVVFRCEGKIQTTFFKYYALCIVQMLCSAWAGGVVCEAAGYPCYHCENRGGYAAVSCQLSDSEGMGI